MNELELKITDPLHKSLIEWYKEKASDDHLMEKLIGLIKDKKNEIEKP